VQSEATELRKNASIRGLCRGGFSLFQIEKARFRDPNGDLKERWARGAGVGICVQMEDESERGRADGTEY
jgi:hypothetical protein